ncbi:hypothetical protein K9N68_07740 [Kovacikia minuta CCNUW1]|uniref:hypothetical protein n=1 Tax=Kovacikia minuta TaxID=2931930 RepID=UPI001CCF38A9|nr:hypothetical protein [Kovacikia minuta]UBF27794.1 hypothetical protein K9N68_07740 [Kovacikia minuta CCNUW1]
MYVSSNTPPLHPSPISVPDAPIQSVASPLAKVDAQVSGPSPHARPVPQAKYTHIAGELNQHSKLLRVKKLMLYASRQEWESDPDRLKELNLEQLIQELHQQNGTREELEQSLQAVVKLLNKREEYSAIARSVVDKLGKLYAHAPEALEEVASEPGPADAVPDPIFSKPEDVGHSSPAPQQPENPPPQALPSLFDYRLGVIKSANPLRAKILLFSALQKDFSEGDHNWFNLKAYDLDGLMRQLLGTCKTYTDLEASLYRAARHFKETEDHLQTATAVIKCLRPFYLHGGSALLLHESTEDTQISLDDFEETTLEFADANDEDELTCQMLTAANSPTGLLESPNLVAGNTLFPSDREYSKPQSEPTSPPSNLNRAETLDDNGCIPDQTPPQFH